MDRLTTPSEKTHSQVNPAPVEPHKIVSRNRSLVIIKTVLGSPIPFLALTFCALLPIYGGYSLPAAWLTAALSLLYILTDRFSNAREFEPFSVGGDVALTGLLLTGLASSLLNSPQIHVWQTLSVIHWIFLIYLLAYTFDLFPGLNQMFRIIALMLTVISAYGAYQFLTGVQLPLPHDTPLGTSAIFSHKFEMRGFFESPSVFSYVIAMFFALPFSAWLIEDRPWSPEHWMKFVGALSLLALVIFSFHWQALMIVFVTAGASIWLAKKKWIFPGAILVGVCLLVLLNTFEGILGWWNEQPHNTFYTNSTYQDLLKLNISIFWDNPWFGAGLHQTRDQILEFVMQKKLPLTAPLNAQNNYFQTLATLGLVGFAFYMIFILSTIFSSLRLFQDIPKSHYWHRVFALTCFAGQLSFHLLGLYTWTFGSPSLTACYVFFVAVTAYMNRHYISSIVPDDQAL